MAPGGKADVAHQCHVDHALVLFRDTVGGGIDDGDLAVQHVVKGHVVDQEPGLRIVLRQAGGMPALFHRQWWQIGIRGDGGAALVRAGVGSGSLLAAGGQHDNEREK